METQALFFALGMLMIIFIAVMVITVISFVKVLKIQNRIKEEFNSLWQNSSRLEDNSYRNQDQMHRDISKEIEELRSLLDTSNEYCQSKIDELYRYIDSRLDKSLNSIKSKSVITD